jgi:hypothetical protein
MHNASECKGRRGSDDASHRYQHYRKNAFHTRLLICLAPNLRLARSELRMPFSHHKIAFSPHLTLMFLDRLDNQIDELSNTLVWFMRDGGGTRISMISPSRNFPLKIQYTEIV